MAHTQPTLTHVTHPLARAAGVDAAIVAFTVAAAAVSFGTGQGVPGWHNIVFTPIVMALAGVAMLLSYVEIRMFRRNAETTTHRGTAAAEVLVPLVAIIVAGPMLLIMPFIFFGAIV